MADLLLIKYTRCVTRKKLGGAKQTFLPTFLRYEARAARMEVQKKGKVTH